MSAPHPYATIRAKIFYGQRGSPVKYYAPLYGPLKLYKSSCLSAASPPQLFVYSGNCIWRRVGDPNKIQGILCEIDEMEANFILESLEDGNYFVCDGFVGMYD